MVIYLEGGITGRGKFEPCEAGFRHGRLGINTLVSVLVGFCSPLDTPAKNKLNFISVMIFLQWLT